MWFNRPKPSPRATDNPGHGHLANDPGDASGPRDFIADTHPPYDGFFSQHPIPAENTAQRVYWNGFYMRYQPVNVARETATFDYWQTFGRPMGPNYLVGPRVVNVPQAIPSRFPNPYLPSGGPDSIVAWIKRAAADVARNRTGSQ